VLRKSGFDEFGNMKYPLPLGAEDRGQSCPRHCTRSTGAGDAPFGDSLGEPLSIREVADLIGCSPWTVRQRYLAHGLPHFRPTPNGKLIFYKNQIIRWLLQEQQKGGSIL